MDRILVINGPNLNFLGIREKAVYGTQSYDSLIEMIRQKAEELGVEAECFQSNHEGAISYAIHDALKSVFVPKIEIHISDIHSRELWRNVSVTAPACDGQIVGHGFSGYTEAMEEIVRRRG